MRRVGVARITLSRLDIRHVGRAARCYKRRNLIGSNGEIAPRLAACYRPRALTTATQPRYDKGEDAARLSTDCSWPRSVCDGSRGHLSP